ncbi:MAG: hypothetical protein Q7R32_04570 [Dehalococcoidia bacterium]|nr:hypothetical protein [Dehalococcoidia bacterium]
MRALFPTILTALTALAALTIWACTGGNSNSANPGGDGSNGRAKVEASCDAIKEIESYRYTISLKLQSPAFEQRDQATPDPLSEFTQALTDLFRDMELDGAYVAPDRSQAVLRFPGQELELRTIGDKSWVRFGATWQDQESPPGEDAILTPAAVCADLVEDLAPSLAAGSGEEEVVNGIETVHYRLDKADLNGLPALLGQSGEEGLPSEFGVDVWLERNNGWPVRLEIAAADTGEDGEPISLELSMEFSAINDPTIEINPPPVSPAQT